MSNLAIVREVKGNRVSLTTVPNGACGGCTSCSAGVGGKDFTATYEGEVTKGDTVVYDMESRNLLMASFLAYGLPLILMLVSMFASIKVLEAAGVGKNSEMIGFLVGIAVVASTYFIIKSYEKKIEENEKFRAKIIRVVERPNQEVFLNVKREL